MTNGCRWAFKARFARVPYGWRESALAGKLLKKAVREINSVAPSRIALWQPKAVFR